MVTHSVISMDYRDTVTRLALGALDAASMRQTNIPGDIATDGKLEVGGRDVSDSLDDMDKARDELAKKAEETIKQVEQVRKDAEAAADAADKKAQQAVDGMEQVRKDAEAGVQSAKDAAAAAAAKADALSKIVDEKTQAAKQAADAASAKADQVKSQADATATKADELAGQITDVRKTVTDQGVRLDGAVKNADAAVTASSEVKQSLTELSATVENHYTEQQKTLDRVSKVEQTANGLTSTVEAHYKEQQATQDRVSKVEQTTDGIKSSVSAVTKTATDALEKASSAEQTANGFRQEVSETYLSKSDASKTYATKTSLTQTASGITARVDEVSKVADAAQSKTAELELTADGLKTSVSKAQSTADGAVTTASNAQQTAEGLKSQVTQTASTAKDALTRATSAEQSITGFKQTVSETYVSKTDAAKTYATQSSLTQTKDAITARVESAASTANAAMGKANTVEQTVNGLKSTVSEQAATLKSTTGTVSQLQQKADGLTSLIQQSSYIMNPGFETGDMTGWNAGNWGSIKVDTGNTQHSGRYWLIAGGKTNGEAWVNSLDFTVVKGHTYEASCWVWCDTGVAGVRIGIQSNSANWQGMATVKPSATGTWVRVSHQVTAPADHADAHMYFGCTLAAGQYVRVDDCQLVDVSADAGTVTRMSKLEQSLDGFKTTVARDYESKTEALKKQSQLQQTIDGFKTTVAQTYATKDGLTSYASKSSLEQTSKSLTSRIEENAKTINGQATTISQLRQTADSLSNRITQVGNTASGAVGRVSSLEQNLNGFKTSVEQTYATNGKLEELGAVVSKNYSFSGAGNAPQWVKLGWLTTAGDSTNTVIDLYTGDGWNGQQRQNSRAVIVIKDAYQSTAGTTKAFGVSVARENCQNLKVDVRAFSSTTCDVWVYLPWAYWNGTYTLSGRYKSWLVKNEHQTAAPTGGVAQEVGYRLNPEQLKEEVAATYTTKAEFKVEKDKITASVQDVTRANGRVEQRVSTIEQKSTSWTAHFKTLDTGVAKAQSTANTAKTNAGNAQSRVGTLETCIKMTSEGVRVGKLSNGAFTGWSAIMHSDGTFRVRSSGGTDSVIIGANRLQVKDQSGNARFDVYSDDSNHAWTTIHPLVSGAPLQRWQTGWQVLSLGSGISSATGGSISYGYRGGLLCFSGRVRVSRKDAQLNAGNVFAIEKRSYNRNFPCWGWRNNAISMINVYVAANTTNVKIGDTCDWVSLDGLTIPQ